MNNFLFSINATMPIFLVILIGWLLKRLGVINDEFANVANKYVFKLALPVLLFKDIATTSIMKNMNIRFVCFCFFGTIIMFTITWIFGLFYCKDKTMLGSFVQSAARGSAAVLGVAFVENICGNSGMAPLMIVSAVPLFNVISVIVLTFGGKNVESKSSGIKTAFINVLKNPIIIGILLGIPFSLLNIEIPTIPLRTINYIAQTATPVALIAIGAGFDTRSSLTRLKPSLVATFIKLIVLPALMLPVAILMGFDSSELIAILIMAGAPSTVSGFIMAKNMHNDHVLSSNTIVISTLVSSVTLTMWVFVLKCVGVI